MGSMGGAGIRMGQNASRACTLFFVVVSMLFSSFYLSLVMFVLVYQNGVSETGVEVHSDGGSFSNERCESMNLRLSVCVYMD